MARLVPPTLNRFPIITAPMRTRARTRHGLEPFDFEAEVYVHEDGLWARWTNETARTWDRAFEGWIVERRFEFFWENEAWEGWPARLIRGNVTATFHEDGSLQLQPAHAILDPDVVWALQGAMRGTSVVGRRRSASEHASEIIEHIQSYHRQRGSIPTMDTVARLMGKWSPSEERANSTFRTWVSKAGGWDELVREALG
jgi:hypothetical protein